MADAGPGPKAAIDAALGTLAEEAAREVEGVEGAAIQYALSGEGKRMRGLLVDAAYRTCGGAGHAWGLAAAVEVVHAYSLVHDDLPCMDDDDVRRGRATVHKAYTVPVATAIGLAMIPLAALAAWRGAASLGLDAVACGAVVRRLMRASGAAGMVGGQLMDLEAEGQTVNLETLQRIHHGKTGCLIEAAVVVGGMGAGAGPEVLGALEEYGRRIGLAFQIADDVLDVTATTAELGKTAGKDLALQKSTYPALLGVDGAMHMAEGLLADAVGRLEAAGVDAEELRDLAAFAVRRRS